MSTLEDWIVEVSRRLELGDQGDLVDPAVVTPMVLDLTRDVAHCVARPAAPITAYLLGLAAARGAGVEGARARAEELAEIARARGGDGSS